MSRNARLTINGILMARPDLFDYAKFPDRLDRDILIDSIVLECGDLGVYYSDPDYMASALKIWSTRRLRIWDEMIDTTEYEYNPIWNKDGTYTETRKDKRNRTGSESTQTDGTGSSSEKSETRHGHIIDNDETDTTQVSGYNGDGWANRDKTTIDGRQSHSGTDVVNETASYKTGETGSKKTADDETGEYTLERSERGNIGVTTTQQMIREQREVINYDIYGIIADEFKSYFCILVY